MKRNKREEYNTNCNWYVKNKEWKDANKRKRIRKKRRKKRVNKKYRKGRTDRKTIQINSER